MRKEKNMKKNSRLAAWILSMTLLLSLCACGTDTPISSDTAAMDSAAPEWGIHSGVKH